MSPSGMGSRDRRALFLGAAILLPALAYIWGVKPLMASLDDTRTLVADQRRLLSQERAAVAAAQRNPDLQRIADSAMRAMTPRLFEGRDDVMATGELLSHIGEVARQNEVLLQSASTRPATVTDGVRTLRVEIRAESDLAGTLNFLQSIEMGDKLLHVERLDISRSMAATEVEGIEPVAIAASIVGYAIADSTAVPATNRRPPLPVRPGAAPARAPGAGGTSR